MIPEMDTDAPAWPTVETFPADKLPSSIPAPCWVVCDATGTPVCQFIGASALVLYSTQKLAQSASDKMAASGTQGTFVAQADFVALLAGGLLAALAPLGCETFAVDWPQEKFLFQIEAPKPFVVSANDPEKTLSLAQPEDAYMVGGPKLPPS